MRWFLRWDFLINVFPFEYEPQTWRAFSGHCNNKTAWQYAISRKIYGFTKFHKNYQNLIFPRFVDFAIFTTCSLCLWLYWYWTRIWHIPCQVGIFKVITTPHRETSQLFKKSLRLKTIHPVWRSKARCNSLKCVKHELGTLQMGSTHIRDEITCRWRQFWPWIVIRAVVERSFY